MMSGGALHFILMILAASAGSDEVVFHSTVRVDAPQVVLGQIADLSMLPPAMEERARILPVATFAANQVRLEIDAAVLAQRVRGQMPGLGPWLKPEASGRIVLRRSAPSAADPSNGGVQAPANCLRVVRPVAAGEAPTPEDFTLASCEGSIARRAFRLDRLAGSVTALRTLSVGEILNAVPTSTLAGLSAGDRFQLSAHVGPVVVRRDVEAVQSAREGQDVFVRTADGAVFAVPYPEVEQ